MAKAKTSSQKKKVAKTATKKTKKPTPKAAKTAKASKVAKPKKVTNPFAKLLEMKNAKLAEKASDKSPGEIWKEGSQASHTWNHRYTKFAGPRRRAS